MHASDVNFDRDSYDMLCVALMPGDVEYNPAETPASIELHGAYYMVVFCPGECVGHLFK